MRRLLLAFLAAAPLLPSARPALATTVIATDLKELSRTANVIVHGRVVNVRSQWTDDRRRIESLVAIEVLDSIKGAAGREVVVRVPGGQLGTLRSVMVGAPNFTAGEEVVLFLNGSAPAIPHLIGLGQSVYRVMTDRDTGRRMVTPPPIGETVVRSSGRIVRGDPGRRPVVLEEFKRNVRAMAAAANRAVPRNGVVRVAPAPSGARARR
jgi:hypothetical protein